MHETRQVLGFTEGGPIKLSPKHIQILGLFANGLRSSEISRKIFLSQGTVVVYAHEARKAFGLDSSLSLAKPISELVLCKYIKVLDVPEAVNLTDTSEKVLKLVNLGFSNNDIAISLGISLVTVRSNLGYLQKAFDANSRYQVAAKSTALEMRAESLSLPLE